MTTTLLPPSAKPKVTRKGRAQRVQKPVIQSGDRVRRDCYNSSLIELLFDKPRRIYVMDQWVIPYNREPDLSLAAVCADCGLDCKEVAADLAECDARVPKLEPIPGLGEREPPATSMLLETVVRHHQYLSQEIPLLGYLLNQVAERHGGFCPELWDVQGLFEELEDHIHAHFVLQEQGLFAALLRPETEMVLRHVRSSAQIMMDTIRTLRMDHTFLRWALTQLRKWTRDFIAPATANPDHRVAYKWLADLDGQLEQCWKAEEAVLRQAELLCQI